MSKPMTQEQMEKGRVRAREYVVAQAQEHREWVAAGCPMPGMVETVMWVWSSLGVDKPGGCPGPFARQLLRWARRNRKEFFTLFVAKLMSGQSGKKSSAEAEGGGEDAALLFARELAEKHKAKGQAQESAS